MQMGENCVHGFVGSGFSDGELMSLVVHIPDGSTYVAFEGMPAHINLQYPLSSQDPVGGYIFEFIGDDNYAMAYINWTGVCQER